ncbi:hypothetical protein M406DRAFT_66236 [Cryphonectria parasitica EP155]|uniref:BZIP domain-containing protein n=1 Tax=Cryphonectria parasitica (strain ATCC 38755 / EP155) TaxID=660469 RepID=A0A9P4YB33_CRYP1|nr:uncharacterized protein M406DRAFT_66236 [Cryphonectria parasitica EP155]KAF3769765.1 hypothetical protein M406DRAFT_66236 [Cryphonectria parasitica EP155]
MDKWSLKPTDHNTIRTRNNQRRHRARVKSRLEDLEKRLEEADARLEAALSTISVLTAELEDLRARGTQTLHRQSLFPRCAGPSPPVPATAPVVIPDTHYEKDPQKVSDPSEPSVLQHNVPVTSISSDPAGQATARTVTPTPDEIIDDDDGSNCNCQTLPPSGPGESTIACTSAFQIVEQQNLSGAVEVAMVRAWLGPGFRRALRPGEACRVETNRLFELLDHITSSS